MLSCRTESNQIFLEAKMSHREILSKSKIDLFPFFHDHLQPIQELTPFVITSTILQLATWPVIFIYRYLETIENVLNINFNLSYISHKVKLFFSPFFLFSLTFLFLSTFRLQKKSRKICILKLSVLLSFSIVFTYIKINEVNQ